jgi:nucleotide-binding universal stress UspA family protein
MIRAVAHPTDLSPEGAPAFEHALAIALARRCPLDVIHVRRPGGKSDWASFPHVREVLQRWNILAPGAQIEDIYRTTGVRVSKVDIRDDDAVDGMAHFLRTHPVDLMVMRSHGRVGVERWLGHSVSAELAQETIVPTLVLGPAARPFVDSRTGRASLGRVVVPVDHDPEPNDALRILGTLVEGFDVELDLLHVGERAPEVRDEAGRPRSVRTLDGPVVETLLEESIRAGLMAMPTAGRRNFLDALRGSTTERVIGEASCPVLAIPVG